MVTQIKDDLIAVVAAKLRIRKGDIAVESIEARSSDGRTSVKLRIIQEMLGCRTTPAQLIVEAVEDGALAEELELVSVVVPIHSCTIIDKITVTLGISIAAADFEGIREQFTKAVTASAYGLPVRLNVSEGAGKSSAGLRSLRASKKREAEEAALTLTNANTVDCGDSAGEEEAVALFDNADEAELQEGDLIFKAGDRILVTNQNKPGEGWWTGNAHGLSGIFPANFVQLLEEGDLHDASGAKCCTVTISARSPADVLRTAVDSGALSAAAAAAAVASTDMVAFECLPGGFEVHGPDSGTIAVKWLLPDTGADVEASGSAIQLSSLEAAIFEATGGVPAHVDEAFAPLTGCNEFGGAVASSFVLTVGPGAHEDMLLLDLQQARNKLRELREDAGPDVSEVDSAAPLTRHISVEMDTITATAAAVTMRASGRLRGQFLMEAGLFSEQTKPERHEGDDARQDQISAATRGARGRALSTSGWDLAFGGHLVGPPPQRPARVRLVSIEDDAQVQAVATIVAEAVFDELKLTESLNYKGFVGWWQRKTCSLSGGANRISDQELQHSMSIWAEFDDDGCGVTQEGLSAVMSRMMKAGVISMTTDGQLVMAEQQHRARQLTPIRGMLELLSRWRDQEEWELLEG